NGDVVEVCDEHIRIADRVPAGIELVDSSREGVVNGDVLRDRRQIAGDGIVTIAISIGLDGKLSATPDIQLNGVVLSMERTQLFKLLQESIDKSLQRVWLDFARNVGTLEIDWTGLRYQLERDLGKMLRNYTQSRPMLVLLLQTPSTGKVEPAVAAAIAAPVTTTPAAGKRRRAAAVS
ncbi:MAG: ribonuclease J, partial [Pseudanabaena sp. CRU_2_10]|nr:ribonuclease J [Pseudanabaena sp. CRU_2_10]